MSKDLVLGFTTAGPYCGVALCAGGDVIAALHEELAKGQAERLTPMIEDVLHAAGVTVADLNAIGVGAGPGNFTGIRISVSAARGLALGLGIPAVGVSTLEALAFGQPRPVLASVAAGRDKLYLERFAQGDSRGPDLVDTPSADIWGAPGLVCVGERCADVAAALEARSVAATQPPAVAVALIAAERWRGDPQPPAPIYLRRPDAAPGRDTPPVIVA